MNSFLKQQNTVVIVLGINGIQRMGFCSDLIEVVPDVMQLPHHREEVRGRSFFWYNTVDKIPQIGGNRQVAAPCLLLKTSDFCFIQP